MGDTGSMALGGAMAAVAVIMNIELIVPMLCFVYFMESVSVIIQVLYFKKTGRRFFRMAPIHHHFEMCGMKETQIVAMYAVVTLALAALAILSAVKWFA